MFADSYVRQMRGYDHRNSHADEQRRQRFDLTAVGRPVPTTGVRFRTLVVDHGYTAAEIARSHGLDPADVVCTLTKEFTTG